MSSEVKLFDNPEFGKVRVIMRNGEPWFVASDVAKALGYENPAEAVQDHCKKVNKINHHSKTLPPTPPVNFNIIPESDVYRLVMRSNLKGAEKFQTWVCEDVLPSIRKTGQYGNALLPDFANPAIAARAWAEQYERRQIAEQQRDEAIRTKAEIGTRREATAMATASVLSKENDKLRVKIGDSKYYKQVKAIPWLFDVFVDRRSMYSMVGRKLSEISRRMGYEIKEVEDVKYGIVNAYHIDIIYELFDMLQWDKNMLRKYRRF